MCFLKFVTTFFCILQYKYICPNFWLTFGFDRYRLSHWNLRGHGSLCFMARSSSPIVHPYRLPLMTINPNITLITNSVILAAPSILSAGSESQALYSDSHTLTQLLTQSDQLLRQLPALLHRLLMLRENKKNQCIISQCITLLKLHKKHNLPKKYVAMRQGNAKCNLMSWWMNISGNPCADMNYALASEGCLSIIEQDELAMTVYNVKNN